MEKTELIKLLNQDLEDEPGAIIQYLGHAYARWIRRSEHDLCRQGF